jgi:hypothetical protein
MSYARWSADSSVYVYLDVGGFLCCCGCSLAEGNRLFWTTADLIAHLHEHENAGGVIEDDTFAHLIDEAADNDAWIARAQAQVQAFIELDLQASAR